MIKNLQYLRAIAAILVLCNHFFIKILDSPYAFITNKGFLENMGAFGVDIFFILSGFIMGHTQKETRDYRSFIIDRIIRIYPPFLLAAFLYTIYAAYYEGLNISYILRNYLLSPGVNEASYKIYLYPGWSLVYEMIFYLIFTVSLLFTQTKIKVIYLTIFFMSCLLIGSNIFYPSPKRMFWVNLPYMTGDLLLINFMAGCLLSLFYKKIKEIFSKKYFMLSIAIITFISLWINFDISINIRSQLYRLITIGLPSFLLVVMAISSKEINSKTLLNVGNSSYSIYLFHPYFITFFLIIKSKFLDSSSIMVVILDLVFFIITIASGVAIFTYIEKPLVSKIKGRFLSFSKPESSKIDVA